MYIRPYIQRPTCFGENRPDLLNLVFLKVYELTEIFVLPNFDKTKTKTVVIVSRYSTNIYALFF